MQHSLEQDSSAGDEQDSLCDILFDEGELSDVELNARLELSMEEYIAKVMRGLNGNSAASIKHGLPLARIKRIMRQDACENPRMIGADAAPCLAFACQHFVGIAAVRAWAICTRDSRYTIQAKDMITAFELDSQTDFLIYVLDRCKKEIKGYTSQD